MLCLMCWIYPPSPHLCIDVLEAVILTRRMPSCNFLVFSPLSWLLEIFSLNSNKNIVPIFWSAAQVMKIFLWKCWMKCFNFWSDASSLRVTVQASAARATTKTKHHQKLCLQPGNKVVILFEQKLALTLWHQNSNTDQYLWAFAKIWKKKYVLPQQVWSTWMLRGPRQCQSSCSESLQPTSYKKIFWGIFVTFGLWVTVTDNAQSRSVRGWCCLQHLWKPPDLFFLAANDPELFLNQP